MSKQFLIQNLHTKHQQIQITNNLKTTTPVWEQERNTQEVDPFSECKKLHDVLYAAEKSLQDLHGVLYHQINKYGSAYLDQMKQFDAGIYSVSDIDEKIDSLNDQTVYLVDF